MEVCQNDHEKSDDDEDDDDGEIGMKKNPAFSIHLPNICTQQIN